MKLVMNYGLDTRVRYRIRKWNGSFQQQAGFLEARREGYIRGAWTEPVPHAGVVLLLFVLLFGWPQNREY